MRSLAAAAGNSAVGVACEPTKGTQVDILLVRPIMEFMTPVKGNSPVTKTFRDCSRGEMAGLAARNHMGG